MTPLPLRSVPLFGDCDDESLDALSVRLTLRRLAPGERLMTQDDPSRLFAIVVDGELLVVRREDDGERELARVGPGSIVGEIGLLARQRRTASVSATTASEVLTGDAGVFAEVLELPGVRERLQRLASIHLAENVRPVPASLPDGTPLLLRPVLPSDRETLATAVREVSAETLRKRFFEAGIPSARTIDYLVNINYVDHFAWAVFDGTDGDTGLAVGRYVRLREQPDTAEVAFAVTDRFQGRGIGTVLLGAVAAAATPAGITRFTATMLSDNTAMRKVFGKVHARFSLAEPGVSAAELSVADARSLLDPDLAERLEAAARSIVSAIV